MTKNEHKTGNRKCWHVVDQFGSVITYNMTKVQAEQHAIWENRNASDRNLSTYMACQDGYKIVECPGLAHSNAMIDNCMVCAPRWGWIMVPEQEQDTDGHDASCSVHTGGNCTRRCFE